ncbi:adenosylcobinamide-GDP ribazoletransferase [Microvirga thermotolerans]|uniref:Adenosylcobinamide-GDP ribazoletransferase n=1 Tax=Microvirga thermotolerans TaxID=2651334 RepID=A0A5P9JWS2_9HYPH|nr:adenosylcobinamide-GDP ribazoletransferase [Microvirga thermotolerans]QFU17047.1 adenosylcobinamide-GDP ribazoletransferase [Microvirga thermotolerans]
MSDQLQQADGIPPGPCRKTFSDLARALRFYSRLPIPALPWEDDPHGLPDFGRIVRVLPLAGLVLGLLPAAAFGLSLVLGLGPWLAAILSVATATVTTGAFHEDGLADTTDSFGGATRERRLAIMKDSLIGSFGTSALVLGFSLRIAALATLAGRTDAPAVMAAIVLVAALSRVAGLVPLVFLPPARSDGAAQAVGRPAREDFWRAAALAAALALLLGLSAGLPASGIALTAFLSALAGIALAGVAKRHIQGQTGDIAGAAQQVAEIAALIGLLIALRP